MASGKTETGKILAGRLNRPFVDLDLRVARHAGQSIPQLFEKRGEPYFRELESRLLRQTADQPRAVIATGGGAPCHLGGMDWIHRHGLSVFLDVPPELLARRLSEDRQGGRPLLKGMCHPKDLDARIRQLLARRLPVYRQAHMRVQAADTPAAVAREIEQHWLQITGH